MPIRTPRRLLPTTALRSRLAAAALLLAVGLLAPQAVAQAPQFTCRGATTSGSWQRLPIERFQPIAGVPSTDAVTDYAVAAERPQVVVATNGKRLKVSTVYGCAWEDGLTLELQPSDEVPLSGTTSTIVSTAVLSGGRVLAAVHDGAGGVGRPHVVGSADGRPPYRMQDTGLPAEGAPTLLVPAHDGRTVYLVLAPATTADEVDDTLGLPGLPGATPPPAPAGQPGLLYASTDEGRSWLLRTTPQDLPAGGGGVDQLTVDRDDAQRLYARANGRLIISTNGGRTFKRAQLDAEVTAIEALSGGNVAVFTADGRVSLSSDYGHNFSTVQTSVGAVTSAAYRRGDGMLAVEAKGRLALLDPKTGRVEPTSGPIVTAGSLRGDVSDQATYHALSGHDLVRYVDSVPSKLEDLPPATSDYGMPPPPPGLITPAARTVRLPAGASAVYDYTLELRKSRTPLDLVLLIDTAPGMARYLDELKANLNVLTARLQQVGIHLQVGVATFGTGPARGGVGLITPQLDPNDPTALGNSLYRMVRRVGPVDAELFAALRGLQSQPENGERSQLLALEQAAYGAGVQVPLIPAGAPVYLVPPNRNAAWRPDPGIRRIIALATDARFGNPIGSPNKPDGSLDFPHAVRVLKEWQDVQHIGINTGPPGARRDLVTMSAGTLTFAPPGGADCGDGSTVPAGQPLVCDTTSDFSAVLAGLITDLEDLQNITVAALGPDPHLVTARDTRALERVDVVVPNLLPFSLQVSCAGRPAGRWVEVVAANLRGVQVAQTQLDVECLGSDVAAVARPTAAPAPAPVQAPQPPVQPAVPAAPAPAQAGPAAAPAVQPQVQPQAQAQLQAQPQPHPLTVAALQQQEEEQLALQLARGRGDTETELAMVNRHRQDERAALHVLAVALVLATALGALQLRIRQRVVTAPTTGGRRTVSLRAPRRR